MIDVESQWYEALFEEDCLRVMRLLREYPRLLKQGWESEPSRTVEGSRLDYRAPKTKSEWKGRTALHVGARRGCAELVTQVMQLYNVKLTARSVGDLRRGVAKLYAQGVGTSNEVNGDVNGPELKRPRSGREEDVDRKLQRAQSIVNLWKGEVDDKRQERAQRVLARWKRMTVGGDLGESADESLGDLLLAQDGEYKLDALAMALLNGNLDVLSILLKASLFCKTVPDIYGISRLSLSVWDGVAMEKKKEESTIPTGKRKEMLEHMELLHAAERTEGQLQIAVGHREQLRKITAQVIATLSNSDHPASPIFLKCLKLYDKHRDFNFLPREEFLFHFLLTDCFEKAYNKTGYVYDFPDDTEWGMLKVLGVEWSKCCEASPALCLFLLELQDGQGRTPLHVAVDESTVGRFISLMSWEMGKENGMRAINALDGGGRTPLHRAITLDKEHSCTELLHLSLLLAAGLGDWFTEPKKYDYSALKNLLTAIRRSMMAFQKSNMDSVVRKSGFVLNVDALSQRNGFTGLKGSLKEYSTPLQSSIIHKRTGRVRELLDYEAWASIMREPQGAGRLRHAHNYEAWSQIMDEAQISHTFPWFVQYRDEYRTFELDPLELATLVGQASIVKELVGNPSKELLKVKSQEHPWPALHIAAASGKYDLLKLLVDNGHDPLVIGLEENTALHHATKGIEVMFDTHLLDYVNCEHILETQESRHKDLHERRGRQCLKSDAYIVEREGCINLLLQAGCDIFKINIDRQAPYPGLNMSAKFISWWYEKQAKEFDNVQSTLTIATNAISVTAALVATASYVGPLQPPLGYNSSGPGGLQLGNLWVKIFIVCDTMSFYLGIAAIISSLIPSLPMVEQSMTHELRRTRRMVTLSVSILLPSIIFVLVAFASSSIAVVANKVGSWNYGGLSIGTASFGGLVCIVTIFLFFIRLLGFIFHRNKWIRKVYNATSF